MARSRSLGRGRVFKDFKDKREYQSPVSPCDFPDPPHYAIMPEEVRQQMKQDMTRLTRAQADELFRINKQYKQEYNHRNRAKR